MNAASNSLMDSIAAPKPGQVACLRVLRVPTRSTVQWATAESNRGPLQCECVGRSRDTEACLALPGDYSVRLRAVSFHLMVARTRTDASRSAALPCPSTRADCIQTTGERRWDAGHVAEAVNSRRVVTPGIFLVLVSALVLQRSKKRMTHEETEPKTEGSLPFGGGCETDFARDHLGIRSMGVVARS